MADEGTFVNETVVHQSPANPRLEKTTNSPPMQNGDIREIDEERYQPHKTYCFNNCGTVNVNVNSFNAHGVIMENCSNHVRQVACHCSPRIIGYKENHKVLHSQLNATPSQTSRTHISTSVDHFAPFSWTCLMVVLCIAILIISLHRL